MKKLNETSKLRAGVYALKAGIRGAKQLVTNPEVRKTVVNNIKTFAKTGKTASIDSMPAKMKAQSLGQTRAGLILTKPKGHVLRQGAAKRYIQHGQSVASGASSPFSLPNKNTLYKKTQEGIEMKKKELITEGEMSRIHAELSPHLPQGHKVHGIVAASPGYVIVKASHAKYHDQFHYHHLAKNDQGGWKYLFKSEKYIPHHRTDYETNAQKLGEAAKLSLGAKAIKGIGKFAKKNPLTAKFASETGSIVAGLGAYDALKDAGKKKDDKTTVSEGKVGTTLKVGLGFAGGVAAEHGAQKYLDKQAAKRGAKTRARNLKKKMQEGALMRGLALPAIKARAAAADAAGNVVKAAKGYKSVGRAMRLGITVPKGTKFHPVTGKPILKTEELSRRSFGHKVVMGVQHAGERAQHKIEKGVKFAKDHPIGAAKYVLTKPYRDAKESGRKIRNSVLKTAAIAGSAAAGYHVGHMMASETEYKGDPLNEMSAAEAHIKMQQYKDLGYKISDTYMQDGKVAFTVTDKEGNQRRHTYSGNKRSVESLGQVQTDHDDDDAPKKKRGRPPKDKFKIVVKK